MVWRIVTHGFGHTRAPPRYSIREEQRAHKAEEAAAAAAIAAQEAVWERERKELKAELAAVMKRARGGLKQRDWDAMGPEWSAKVARYKQLKAGQNGRA